MTARKVVNFGKCITMGFLAILTLAPASSAQTAAVNTVNENLSPHKSELMLTAGENNDKERITVGECLKLPVTATIFASATDGDLPVVWTVDGYPMKHGADFATRRFAGHLTWTPQISDTGIHQINFTVSYGGFSSHRAIEIVVMKRQILFAEERPRISPEPEYTSGHSNTIYCNPLPFDICQQLCIFDADTDAASPECYDLDRFTIDTLADGRAAITVIGLEHSTRYGYYLVAQSDAQSKPGRYSDTVYSVQDFTPPGQIIEVQVITSDLGKLLISWNGVSDDLTEVAQYELYRRGEAGEFILLGTVPAMRGDDDCNTHYTFSESIADRIGLTPMSSFQYMVKAVDGAGNNNEGVLSALVYLRDINGQYTGRPEPADSSGGPGSTNAIAR